MTVRSVCRFVFAAGMVALVPVVQYHGGAAAARGERSPAPGEQRRTVPPATHSARPVAVAMRATPNTKPVIGMRVAPDGTRQVFFGGPELQFQKTSRLNGRSTLTLEAEGDRVDITVSPANGFTVARGGRAVSFYPADASEAHYDQARAVLAGSKAIRRFRGLVARLDDPKSASVLGLQISDAIVGFLDGDVGAPERLRREIRQRRAARVRLAAADDEDESVCWRRLEEDLNGAMDNFEQCVGAVGAFNPVSAFCAATWIIESEGIWWQYLTCVGVGNLIRR